MSRILIWCIAWICAAYLFIVVANLPYTGIVRLGIGPLPLLLLIWCPAAFILWGLVHRVIAYLYPNTDNSEKKKKRSPQVEG